MGMMGFDGIKHMMIARRDDSLVKINSNNC